MKTPYNPLLIAFVYHFNETEDYFECHEVLEELWMEEGRDIFYQGLLADCCRVIPLPER
ncbi:DUF309 domain-containing protein [Paenibacillus larvae]|nr:DUF309 domain-containing protein [Paenibacillus larvae]MDT2309670.1 DUF309 domain-containing protein [Paenibacillus larvae]